MGWEDGGMVRGGGLGRLGGGEDDEGGIYELCIEVVNWRESVVLVAHLDLPIARMQHRLAFACSKFPKSGENLWNALGGRERTREERLILSIQ